MKRCLKCGANQLDEVLLCDCGADLKFILPEEVKKANSIDATSAGKRAEPPGCAAAFIVFLTLVFLATLGGAPIELSLPLAIVGAVIAGAFAIGAARPPGSDLKARIEARKKEALDKKIWETACTVAMHYGQWIDKNKNLRFADHQIEIMATPCEGKSLDLAITWIAGGGGIVFESHAGSSRSTSGYTDFAERTVIRPLEGGAYEVAKEYSSEPGALITINGYIPGPWVRHLQNLEKRVELEHAQAKEAKEMQERQKKIQAERSKFGL